jgi:hypothetical protein
VQNSDSAVLPVVPNCVILYDVMHRIIQSKPPSYTSPIHVTIYSNNIYYSCFGYSKIRIYSSCPLITQYTCIIVEGPTNNSFLAYINPLESKYIDISITDLVLPRTSLDLVIRSNISAGNRIPVVQPSAVAGNYETNDSNYT